MVRFGILLGLSGVETKGDAIARTVACGYGSNHQRA